MKTNLTEHQRNFLLHTFFENEQFAGWKNIANNLMNKGECIVGGTEPIWKGGIGNHIETSTTESYVECLLYKFNLEEFLSSEFYKEVKDAYMNKLKVVRDEFMEKFNEIDELAI